MFKRFLNNNFTSSFLQILFALIFPLISFSQVVEKASMMRHKNPYGSETPYFYKSLSNGNKIITGRVNYELSYKNWHISNGDSLPPTTRMFVALVNQNDSLLWVIYMNAWVQNVESDINNNIYLTGTYKDKLHTSTGDTLPLLSNNTNYYGNVFIIKLDANGQRKWWKTTDNEAWVQFNPYGDYLKIDPDGNVYMAGHFNYFIRFNEKYSFVNNPNSSLSFLAKLDSNGQYQWVRHWNYDKGIPAGLSIDNCGIYQFITLGTGGMAVRYRKYDFSGKLINQNFIPHESYGMFWMNNVNIKNNRILKVGIENNYAEQYIGYYDLSGNPIWKVNCSPEMEFRNLQFTEQSHIFFSGYTHIDTAVINGTPVPGNIFWGFMDTTGNVLNVKSHSKAKPGPIPFLTRDGRLYVSSFITYHSNNNSSSYTIDTITFNNLNYNGGTGIVSGVQYQLFSQYVTGEEAYYNPGNCNFSPQIDTCLNAEGRNLCQITLVADINENKNLIVFPNPAQSWLKLVFTTPDISQKVAVQVVDITGITRLKINNFSPDNTIDISSLSAGIYFIRIQFRNGSVMLRKVVITK